MEEKENRPQDEQGAVIARRGSRSVKLIEVIEVNTCVGKGTVDDPKRIITEYWSEDGVLLAVNDPASKEVRM